MTNRGTYLPSIGTESTILPDRSRYDLHLLAFPLVFAAGAGTATLAGVAIELGLLAAAIVAAFVMLDGLFRHPPTTN